MSTTRLDIRLDESVKLRAEKAAALLGLNSLTDFVIQAMSERANEVLKEYGKTVLQDEVFDQFMEACEKASEPNAALRDAVSYTREQGYR